MAHAELCPVCKGGRWVPAFSWGTCSFDMGVEPCYACNGTGWVTVVDEPRFWKALHIPDCGQMEMTDEE